MRVWRCKPIDPVEQAGPVLDSDFDAFDAFKQGPLIDTWKPIPFRLSREDSAKLVRSDFPCMTSDVLIMKSTAAQFVRSLGQPGLEILPLECDECDLWALNVLNVLEAVDMDKSEVVRFPSTGRLMTIARHVFHPEVVEGVPLFKIRALRRGPIYYGDSFVEQYRASGLTGLEFEPIWSSC